MIQYSNATDAEIWKQVSPLALLPASEWRYLVTGLVLSIVFVKSRVDRNSQAIPLFTQFSFSLTGILP